MKYIVVLLVLLGLGFGTYQLYQWGNQPPEVSFVRATRGTLVSEVSTNGKVDPIEFTEARAESSGPVQNIYVQLRQQVKAGDPLVKLDTSLLQQDLETISAQIQEVRTRLAALDAGGRRPEKVALETDQRQLQVQLDQARRDLEAEKRLLARDASTREAVETRQNQVDRLESQINGINSRLGALVDPTDRAPLEAQIEQFQSQRRATELRIEQSTVRAPISGTIFEFDLKPGAYLNAGDAVATIGRLDRVRVVVYVDEPDLGRVKKGQPVTITWDALPNRRWTGEVDRLPTQIQPLDSRQVGQVTCIIQNPDLDLLPGANATARIRTEEVQDAVSIPKEAVFRQGAQAGVYLLVGDHLEWHPITQGINNVTRVEVNELSAGDAIALPSDRTYSDGMIVRPRPPDGDPQ